MVALAAATSATAAPRCIATEKFPVSAPTELEVAVECTVAPEKRVTDCTVITETPKGYSYGRDLMDFAKSTAEWYLGDTPVGRRVRVCGESSLTHPLNIAPVS